MGWVKSSKSRGKSKERQKSERKMKKFQLKRWIVLGEKKVGREAYL